MISSCPSNTPNLVLRNLDGKKAVKQLKELNFDLSPSITLDANITAPVDAPTSVGTIEEEIQKMMDARDVASVNKIWAKSCIRS